MWKQRANSRQSAVGRESTAGSFSEQIRLKADDLLTTVD